MVKKTAKRLSDVSTTMRQKHYLLGTSNYNKHAINLEKILTH